MKNNDTYMSAEGYDLIGAAFEVHSELGGGLSEEIYQESMELELSNRSIIYSSKAELRVYYKDKQLKTKCIPDLTVSGAIIVELKSVRSLTNEHERQLINYMRITKSAVGYLINFGPIGKLEWKRFIISEFIP